MQSIFLSSFFTFGHFPYSFKYNYDNVKIYSFVYIRFFLCFMYHIQWINNLYVRVYSGFYANSLLFLYSMSYLTFLRIFYKNTNRFTSLSCKMDIFSLLFIVSHCSTWIFRWICISWHFTHPKWIYLIIPFTHSYKHF